MSEVWLPCVGYEGYYEVSNLGNVRSVARMVNNHLGNALRKSPTKLLKSATGSSGYSIVSFCVDGVKSNQSVHRLVARAFIENPSNKPQVNHKNGIKTDNRLENLEWATVSENGLHSYAVLGNVAKNKPAFGIKNPKAKPVIAINLETGEEILIAGTRQKKELGFTQTAVDKAIREGKTYRGWAFKLDAAKAEVEALKNK